MAVTNVELVCEICGKIFIRRAAEHNRNMRKDRRVFCGNSCSTIYRNNNSSKTKRILAGLRIKAYTEKYGNPKKNDDLSPFRLIFKTARTHAKNKNREFDITLEFLLELWNRQGGRCVYTGWELKIPENTRNVLKLSPYKASLDRIDSSRGYTKDNVQFVCYMANMAKNIFVEEDLIRFCKSVVNNIPSV